MKALSLCSGYAGLELGLDQVLDVDVVAVCDPDDGAAAILAHRFPDVPNLGNLKAIDWDDWTGVDVLMAGYPCQPFSSAGKRDGRNDERHLFPYIAEGIRRVGPRLVVLENVRGHLSLGFDAVLGSLADLGYDARWTCLRASSIGAPHHRERLFLVATPHTGRVGAQVPAQWGHAAIEQPRGPRAPWGAGDAADAADLRPSGIRAARAGRPGPSDRGNHTADADSLRLQGVGGVDQLQRHPDRRAGSFGKYADAITRWEAVVGRPAPDPRELAPRGGQRLSPRFVEWMMGLPAGWVTDVPGLPHTAKLHALGNGVVPQQAAAAVQLLLDVEEVAA